MKSQNVKYFSIKKTSQLDCLLNPVINSLIVSAFVSLSDNGSFIRKLLNNLHDRLEEKNYTTMIDD